MTAVAVAVGIGIAGASGLAVWAGTSADSGSGDGSGGMPGMPGGRGGGPGGMQGGFGGMQGAPDVDGGSADALHSESVVEVDGGYETRLTQTGSVTSAGVDSVTVRSADDYIETYTIDADTAVTGGAGDAGELTEGSTVTVTATVEGDTAVATTIGSGRSRGGLPQGGDGGAAGAAPPG